MRFDTQTVLNQIYHVCLTQVTCNTCWRRQLNVPQDPNSQNVTDNPQLRPRSIQARVSDTFSRLDHHHVNDSALMSRTQKPNKCYMMSYGNCLIFCNIINFTITVVGDYPDKNNKSIIIIIVSLTKIVKNIKSSQSYYYY